MYGLSPVSDVQPAKQPSIKLMRRTVSKRLDGISVKDEQAKKQSVNVMLDVVVPIAENSVAGILLNEVHSAKVAWNDVTAVVAANRVSGILFSDLHPWNIPFTLVTFVLLISNVAGIDSNDEQSAKVPVNCVASVFAANRKRP